MIVLNAWQKHLCYLICTHCGRDHIPFKLVGFGISQYLSEGSKENFLGYTLADMCCIHSLLEKPCYEAVKWHQHPDVVVTSISYYILSLFRDFFHLTNNVKITFVDCISLSWLLINVLTCVYLTQST